MTRTRQTATEETEPGGVPFRKRLHFVLWWAAALTVIVSVLSCGVGLDSSDGGSYEIRVGYCAMFVMYGPPVYSGPLLDGLEYPSKGTRLRVLLPGPFRNLKSLSLSDIPLLPRSKKWCTVNMVFIPLWPISLSAIVYLAVSRYCRKRKRRKGCCLRCGYDLTGNESGVCPECGARVEA